MRWTSPSSFRVGKVIDSTGFAFNGWLVDGTRGNEDAARCYFTSIMHLVTVKDMPVSAHTYLYGLAIIFRQIRRLVTYRKAICGIALVLFINMGTGV